MPTIKNRLTEFEQQKPEITFSWKDPESEAEGWVVINSLRGGAAGGGTRMRPGLDRHEVESLAKTMEIKFSVSGPPIGGAKSGINFDPRDPRKQQVLKRWFQAVQPLLKHYYGTGGDLNIDELSEVIPLTEDYGLWHPQEGIVNGHLRLPDANKIKILGQLRQGVSKIIEDPVYSPSVEKKLTIADMITGYGVAAAVRHYYQIWGGQLKGKRVIIQGWGNVARGAAFYLSQAGARIVGIIDIGSGLLNPDGFSHQQLTQLILSTKDNRLAIDQQLGFNEIDEKIWDMGAEIFIPAAASRLIELEHIRRMSAAGLEIISCGANVPFKDQAIFYGPIAEEADNHLSVIPDFIANCGMARVFANLMNTNVAITDELLFKDVDQNIRSALTGVYATNSKSTGITAAAYKISLDTVMA